MSSKPRGLVSMVTEQQPASAPSCKAFELNSAKPYIPVPCSCLTMYADVTVKILSFRRNFCDRLETPFRVLELKIEPCQILDIGILGRNVGLKMQAVCSDEMLELHVRPHGGTTRRTNNGFFTAVGTSDLTQLNLHFLFSSDSLICYFPIYIQVSQVIFSTHFQIKIFIYE